MSQVSRSRWRQSAAGFIVLTGLAVGWFAPPAAAQNPATLELVFSFGSEKEKWLQEATAAFHKSPAAVLPGGTAVKVKLIPLGSGECMDAVMGKFKLDGKAAGAEKAHLVSPASPAYLRLAVAECKKGEEIVKLDAGTRNLVTSPVVIAMWEDMAKALGWPQDTSIGWRQVFELAEEDKGWAKRKRPEWGRFKFGHTHPEFSNSGLLCVLAQAYYAAGTTDELTLKDVRRPETQKKVEQIERAVMFYGQSTGFFQKQMVQNGMSRLSAAVLYESSVIEANTAEKKPERKLIAIYPSEGTFMSDHPVGVVEREWVTDAHRTAAKQYIDFLLEEPQQQAAMRLGFRPGNEAVKLDATVFSEANGVDSKQPRTSLLMPSTEVMSEVKGMWAKAKKPVRVSLVVDVSTSMDKDEKLPRAKAAAKEFLDQLSDRDDVTLMTFSNEAIWLEDNPVTTDAKGKERLKARVKDLITVDQTALYDAVVAAHDTMTAQLKDDPRGRVAAIVLLSDGQDNKSKAKLQDVLDKVSLDSEGVPIRIFTIAYGKDAEQATKGADQTPLEQIAERSGGKKHKGEAADIKRILREIFLGL